MPTYIPLIDISRSGYLGVAVVIEAVLLGTFAVSAVFALHKFRRRYAAPSSSPTSKLSNSINSISFALIFVLAATHLVVSLYPYLRHMAQRGRISEGTNDYAWTYPACLNIFNMPLLLGDSLLVYRMYVVNGKNYKVVILQGVVLSLEICTFTAVLHFSSVGMETPVFWMVLAVHTLSFCQNATSSGLLVMKIWYQHKISRAARIKSELNLRQVADMIWQSALLYSLLLLPLVVLFWAQSNFFWMLQKIITPTIGLNSVMLSLRLNALTRTTTSYSYTEDVSLEDWPTAPPLQAAEVSKTLEAREPPLQVVKAARLSV